MSAAFDIDLFDGISPTSSGLPRPSKSPVGLLVSAGTGGDPTIDSSAVDQTASVIYVTSSGRGRQEPPASETFYSPAARLSVIRRWFSFTIKDLADVMRVQRPTIYAWLTSSSVPQSSNVARLRQLYDLAMAWRHLGGRPMARVVDGVEDPYAIKATLSAAVIDTGAMLAQFRRAVENSSPDRTEAEQIVAEAGIEPMFHDEPQTSIDAETLFT